MRRFALVLSALFTVAGCVGEIGGPPVAPTDHKPVAQTQTNQFATARIWVQDDPWFLKSEIKRGCEFWLDAGVQCLLVADQAESDIHMTADYDACPAADGGGVVVAWADGTGHINVYVRCLAQDDGSVNVAYLREMAAHEIGHQLGVWDHVPDKCDGTEKVASNGTHVCGTAVMNPRLNSLPTLTERDLLAFQLRDQVSNAINGTVTTTRSALTDPNARVCTFIRRTP